MALPLASALVAFDQIARKRFPQNNFFALLVLRSRRSGGSSLGFRAGSLKATLNFKTRAPKTSKYHI